MSSKALNVCNQSSGLWFCVCDSRGRLLKCFHTHQSASAYEDGYGGAAGEPLREDRSDFGSDGGIGDDGEVLFGMAGGGGSGRRTKGLDEQTEIILAATFLVLIILIFLSFVIYRCEKNYMRRRLHQSFQMSPSSLSTGGHGPNSGVPGNPSSSSGNIPSISVSVQTDAALISTGATTTSSHLHHTSLVGNGHVINMAALLTGGPETGGPPTAAAAAAYHHHHHTLPHSHFRGGGVGSGDPEDSWTPGRGIPSAQSYRDVREVIALPPMTSHSNTLSREHHLAEIGMRSSCTTENLTRSPSATTAATTNGCSGGPGTSNSGPMDDDLIMDYNDGEFILGGGGSSGSNSTSATGNNSNNNNNNGHNANLSNSSINNGTHRF